MFLNIEYYNSQKKSFLNSLLDQIIQIQKADICCDLKVVLDFGVLWTHTSALFLYGKLVRVNLLRESSSNIVMLPGVSQVEVETFILEIYCQNIATENKYSKQQSSEGSGSG